MGKRILIIDDDKKLRNLFKEYLEGYGYEILNTLRIESQTLISDYTLTNQGLTPGFYDSFKRSSSTPV